MRIEKFFSVGLILLFFKGLFAMEIKKITLTEAIHSAQQNSSSLRAAEAKAESSQFLASSSRGTLYPKLSLDGSYRSQSVVPKVNIGINSIQLTDFYTYSIGPTISYTLWDSGLRRNQIDSLEALSEVKKNQKILTEEQLILSTKLAYVQTALSYDALRAAESALALSRTQNKDIQNRHRSGAVSKLDALSAETEVLNYQLKVSQGENEWKSALAELSYFTGNTLSSETILESLEELKGKTKIPELLTENQESHAMIRLQESMEHSAQAQLELQKADRWPVLSLQLRSSLDYPNGPTLTQINQNSVNLNFSWSLWDFEKTSDLISSKKAEHMAARDQKKETMAIFEKDRAKTKIRLNSLKGQMLDAEAMVKKQEELARLNYSIYQFGKLSFSEVQAANFRLLEARNRLSAIEAQYLVQIYNLQFLKEKDLL